MDSTTIENTYVGVQDGAWMLKKETLPSTPGAGKALVRLAYSTCNPHDVASVHIYKHEEDHRLGVEGSGTIIAIGEGVPASLLNKKVAVLGGGCWSQYKVINLQTSPIILLEDYQDLSKAASVCVNPLSALGQLEIIQKKGSTAYVADAAASALNKILIQLCNKNGIESINIVRKAEQAQALKDNYGAKHVLLQDSPTFKEDLKALFSYQL